MKKTSHMYVAPWAGMSPWSPIPVRSSSRPRYHNSPVDTCSSGERVTHKASHVGADNHERVAGRPSRDAGPRILHRIYFFARPMLFC